MTHTTALERVQACLTRVDRDNATLRALICVDTDGATRAARDADARRAQGRLLGPLDGVPVVIKDNIDTAGLRTTYGSNFFREHVPAVDAEVVRRLRAAGAVLVGKANLQEFAFGIRSTSPIGGQVRNPWDLTRIPGGSSGGSAVALATGMADLALGTDTGASIRLPASLVGVSGLRPTFGCVSNRGTFPLSPSMDTVGPMARRVEDLAHLFAVISGHDSEDPDSAIRELPDPLEGLHDGIAGVRIGRLRLHYDEDLSSDVRAAVDRAAQDLTSLGAEVVDLDVPEVLGVTDAAALILLCDACATHAQRLQAESTLWSSQALERLRKGLQFSGVDYAQAARQREPWCHALRKVFRSVDLLLSPTSPMVAPAIEDPRSLFELSRALSRNTLPGSFGRIPGLAIPCGFSSEGLPIGMQLEAAWWNEPLLLRTGVAYQALTDWHLRLPPLAEANEG